jgi:hypothetical protein
MSKYIYDYKEVKSGRTAKWCSCCSKTIKPGESSITITYYNSEFFTNSVCSKKCKDKYYENFNSDEEEEEDE